MYSPVVKGNRKFLVPLLLLFLLLLLFIYYPAVAGTPSPPDPTEGLEAVEDQAHCAGDLTPGAEEGYLVQVINLKDNDDDKEAVEMIEVSIKNKGTAGLNDIDRIEVVDKSGTPKGSSSLSSFPVTVPATDFNVPDEGEVLLGLKVYLSEEAEKGNTLKFESKLIHTEGKYAFSTFVSDGCSEKIGEKHYTIPYVVSRWDTEEGKLNPDADPTISTDQILQAIAWWADDTQVPNTGGETISTDIILRLISYWADEKEITSKNEQT